MIKLNNVTGRSPQVDQAKLTAVMVALASITIGLAITHAGPESSGVGQLPGKATARLVFLSGANFPGNPCWHPDGSPATPEDLKQGRGSVFTVRDEKHSPRRMLNLFFDIEGLKTDVADGVHLRVDPGPDATVNGISQGDLSPNFSPTMIPKGVTGTYLPPTTQVQSTAMLGYPDDRTQADIRIGIAATPFKLAAQSKPGAAPLNPEVKPMTQSSSSKIDKSTGKWVTTHTEIPNITRVTMDIPLRWAKKDCRLTAFDAKGHALQGLPSVDMHLGAGIGDQHRTFNFMTNSPTDVALIKLEVRDFEWVKFTGVHLKPTNANH